MTIPESIQLLGVTVPVIPLVQDTKHRRQILGEASYVDKTIHLADACRGTPVPQQLKEHTFFHELLHQVLNSAGYGEQNEDEQFVDLVSGLLHQALGPHMK